MSNKTNFVKKTSTIVITLLVTLGISIGIYFFTRDNNITPLPVRDGVYTIVNNWKGSDMDPRKVDSDWKYTTGSPGACDKCNDKKCVFSNDLTQGVVYYGAFGDLVSVDGDKLKIELDSTQWDSKDKSKNCGGQRRSIRISTDNISYDEGLFVISVNHIPEGMAVWPAFWLTAALNNGDAWACGGEIDIIEGVNSVDAESSKNQSTLHVNTPPGGVPCVSTNPNVDYKKCDTTDHPEWPSTCGCGKNAVCPTKGCGVGLDNPNSFGKGLNSAGGGTYACELTPKGGVTVWFFPKGSEPTDLGSTTPNPSKWSSTYMTQLTTSCPKSFHALKLIINTTLCGVWAGVKYPGGQDKCNEYVWNPDNNDKFKDAYWDINYVKVFKKVL
jgi:hypothetical protein